MKEKMWKYFSAKSTNVYINVLPNLVREYNNTRHSSINGIDKIWAADLVNMQAFSKFNRGVKYLLAVIDVFSKYDWLIPLNDNIFRLNLRTFTSMCYRISSENIIIPDILLLR